VHSIDKETLPLKVKPLDGIGINESYETRIKHIFSTIFEYVILAREKFSTSGSEHIQHYSIAVRRLAFCIKEIKHLNKNLMKYMNSYNVVIKGGYNYLRWNIIETVRSIQEIQHMDDHDKKGPLLKQLSEKIKNENTLMIDKIEKAISHRSITATMSTSLVTDTEYTQRACQNLVEMAEILFVEYADNVKLEL
jgi:phosphate:Na+ symporter